MSQASRNRNKRRRQERRAKRKTKIKKFVSRVKTAAPFAVLLPFRKLMQKTLKAIGQSAPDNIADLSKKFFEKIVRKNSYDENYYFGNDNTMLIDDEYDEFIGYDVTKVDNIADEIITSIISAVTGFIKGMMDRKKNQEPMTPVQEKVAEFGEDVEEKYKSGVEEGTSQEVGEIVKKYWWVGVVVVGLLILNKRK